MHLPAEWQEFTNSCLKSLFCNYVLPLCHLEAAGREIFNGLAKAKNSYTVKNYYRSFASLKMTKRECFLLP